MAAVSIFSSRRRSVIVIRVLWTLFTHSLCHANDKQVVEATL